MRKRFTKRSFIRIALIVMIGAMLFVSVADRTIRNATSSKLYSQVEAIPHNKVGLLLGTGKYLRNGAVNPY